MYQIYPRSFKDSNGDGIGDIRGILEKLDYLKALGITMLWLCPIYQSPMDDNGYDVSDYCALAPEFGTMEELDQLIERAGDMRIKIILHLVMNTATIYLRRGTGNQITGVLYSEAVCGKRWKDAANIISMHSGRNSRT